MENPKQAQKDQKEEVKEQLRASIRTGSFQLVNHGELDILVLHGDDKETVVLAMPVHDTSRLLIKGHGITQLLEMLKEEK